MKYEEPTSISKEEVISVLNGNCSVSQKVNALVGAINTIHDPVWLQDLCLSYANHNDEWIAGAAINGLGDIARIFRWLDLKLVLDKFNSVKATRKELISRIDDAIDDIKMFIK